jgi:hypothetical protein
MAVNFDKAKSIAVAKALDAPLEMVIGTWASPESDESFDLWRLRMDEQVAAEFRTVGHRYLRQLADADVIALDLGFTPDDNRLMQLPVAEFDDPNLIERILNPGGLPYFNLGENTSVAFHCFVARRDDVRAGFLHRASSVAVARRNSIFAVLANNVVSRLDSDVLTFAPSVDLLVEPDSIWISNLATFRALFRTMPTLVSGMQADLDAVTAHVPVANLEEFRLACSNDPKMMAKLANVARRPYLSKLTAEQIRKVIDRYHLAPDILNAEGKLVHANSPKRRWLILRILDDSYLESLMTNSHYEVNSKLKVN